MEQVWMMGPCVVAGQILAMEKWRPDFTPTEDAIQHAAVWVRFPDLPMGRRNFVLRLAAAAGTPLFLDNCTEFLWEAMQSHVCKLTSPSLSNRRSRSEQEGEEDGSLSFMKVYLFGALNVEE